MNYSGEVLIYLQKVKAFFENDKKSRDYFLVDVDETLFFNNVSDVAQENYDKTGEAILSMEQFELIRIKMIEIQSENKTDLYIDKIFLNHNGYEKICLN